MPILKVQFPGLFFTRGAKLIEQRGHGYVHAAYDALGKTTNPYDFGGSGTGAATTAGWKVGRAPVSGSTWRGLPFSRTFVFR